MDVDKVNGEQFETCKFRLEKLQRGFRIHGLDDDGDPFTLTISDLWASELALELSDLKVRKWKFLHRA